MTEPRDPRDPRYVAPAYEPPWYPPQPSPPAPYSPAWYRYAPGGPPPGPRPPAPRPELRFGLAAAGISGTGAVLVLLALAGLDWYSFAGGQTTGDVRHVLSGAGRAANGLAVAYYSWLCWLLLVLCAGSAALAAVPHYALSLGFRIAGPILCGLAVLFTVGSVELTGSDLARSDALQSFYYGHVAAGFWITLLGYVLLGAGAVVGPMRGPPQPRRV